ncbi:MAG TPA: 3-hydroxyanthranilate 3,4-dioxygenase [Candidatus Binatia bacterium]|jgi:3-hydroxyanthranilate 3,4-dioxygenase
MDALSTFHLKRWIEENQHLFSPPFKTNRLLVHHQDFLVMMLRGPNTRLDFHIDPGDEFFYQVEGGMELHLKPEGKRREVVHIREGEIFVCPGNLPHSPRRPENTWGLVIERKRKPDETEEFVWFCEKCDAKVLARAVVQGDVGGQVSKVYSEFNADPALRTCVACGYTFPTTPMAERLSFLQPK